MRTVEKFISVLFFSNDVSTEHAATLFNNISTVGLQSTLIYCRLLYQVITSQKGFVNYFF